MYKIQSIVHMAKINARNVTAASIAFCFEILLFTFHAVSVVLWQAAPLEPFLARLSVIFDRFNELPFNCFHLKAHNAIIASCVVGS